MRTFLVCTTFIMGLSFEANAQRPICMPTERLTDLLQNDFGETPASYGLTTDGMVIQMYASMENRTFTVVIHKARGESCIVTTGTNYVPYIPGTDT